MRRTLILGAGGHAQVIADILMRARDAGAPVDPIGYLDDDARLHGEERLGLPILGAIAEIERIAHDALMIAIGDNRTRGRLFERLGRRGEQFAIARHPSATLAPDVVLGPGTLIGAQVVVNPGTVVGANTILNTGCIVEHHNRIADHVHIGPGARLGGDVAIGEGVLIGIGATVMPGRRVGAWSVAGAGALVHGDLPDRVIAHGVPARIVRQLDPREG